MNANSALLRNVNLGRFLGLLQSTTCSSPSKKCISYSFALIILFIILTPLQLYLAQFWAVETVPRYFSAIAWNIMHPVLFCSSLGWHLYQRNHDYQLLKRLYKLTNILNTSSNVHLRRVLVITIISWLILISSDVGHYDKNPSYPIENLQILCTYMTANYFNGYVMILASLLKDFRDELQQYVDSTQLPEKKIAFIMESFEINKRPLFFDKGKDELKHLCCLYQDIYETSVALNKSFALPNVLLVLQATLVSVLEGFNYFGNYRLHLLRAETLPWTLCGLPILLSIIYPCAVCSSLSNEIADVVNGAICRNKRDSELGDELHKFANVLNHEKIVFSPFQLFSIDSGLLLKITGLVASYLVILTQLPNLNWSRGKSTECDLKS